MTSNDTDDVIGGKVPDITLNAKTSVNIYRFLHEIPKTFILV